MSFRCSPARPTLQFPPVVLRILFLVTSTVLSFGDNSFTTPQGNVSIYRQDSSCVCPKKTSDLYYYHCDASKSATCFRCFKSNHTISKEALCNDFVDCPDASDEILCQRDCRLGLDVNGLKLVEHCRQGLNMISLSGLKLLHYENNSVCNNDNFDVNSTDTSIGKGRNLSDLTNGSEKMQGCSFQCLPETTEKKCYGALVFIGLVLGAMAIFGNVAGIFIIGKQIYKNGGRLTREEKVTKYFFLSLSISDFLVAVCTATLCVILYLIDCQDYSKETHSRFIIPCETFGTLTFVGSEQSIFTMVLITVSRVWGVARPFSQVPLKQLLFALPVSWVLSIVVAIIPALKFLQDNFTTSITQDEVSSILTTVTWTRMQDVTAFLRDKFPDKVPSGSGDDTWEELRFFMKELFNITAPNNLGYYHGVRSCLPDIFPKYKLPTYGWYNGFTLSVLGLNMICFVFMVVGYIFIYVKRNKESRNRQQLSAVDKESQKLKRKIFIILASDFICWMPVCIFGFGRFALSRYQEHGTLCNLDTPISMVTMLFILPLNSALNPFIYSAAPEYLHRKCATFFQKNHVCYRYNS